MLGAIGQYNIGMYDSYLTGAGSVNAASSASQTGSAQSSGSTSANASASGTAASSSASANGSGSAAEVIINPGQSTEKIPGHKSSPAECQTCKNRKYQDGSNESNVSFKSAQHIDPSSAYSEVSAHEGEHVANAYNKANKRNGEVVSCNVSIHTAICPECGRIYVSGGTTSTQIKYPNESNPYQQSRKSSDAANSLLGANIDMAV